MIHEINCATVILQKITSRLRISLRQTSIVEAYSSMIAMYIYNGHFKDTLFQ